MKKFAVIFFTALFCFIALTQVVYAESSRHFTYDLIDRVLKAPQVDLELPLPSEFEISDITQDHTVLLKSSDNRISLSITYEQVTPDLLEMLRYHLSDYDATDEEIFINYAGYRVDSLEALQESMERKQVYGGFDSDYIQSEIKLIGSTSESIQGNAASAVMFNYLQSVRGIAEEFTGISIVLPYADNFTIYSIDIRLPQGTLDTAALQKIRRLLSSLTLFGAPWNQSDITLLSDKTFIESANKGIYIVNNYRNIKYQTYSNTEWGYSVDIPEDYKPFKNNSLGNAMDYASFKADHRSWIGITVHDFIQIGETMDQIMQNIRSEKNVLVLSEGIETHGSKQFMYVSYKIDNPAFPIYMKQYLTQEGSYIYSFTITSIGSRYRSGLISEFNKMLASLKFFAPASASLPPDIRFTQYAGALTHFIFEYPETWNVVRTPQHTSQYANMELRPKDPDTPVSIFLVHGEIKRNNKKEAAFELASSTGEQNGWESLVRYTPPYAGEDAVILASRIFVNNYETRIMKLVNFLDSNDRGKVCLAVDVIRGNRIYSLFIIVSDFMVVDGKIKDANLDHIINTLFRSFTVKNLSYASFSGTPEKRGSLIQVYVNKGNNRGYYITLPKRSSRAYSYSSKN